MDCYTFEIGRCAIAESARNWRICELNSSVANPRHFGVDSDQCLWLTDPDLAIYLAIKTPTKYWFKKKFSVYYFLKVHWYNFPIFIDDRRKHQDPDPQHSLTVKHPFSWFIYYFQILTFVGLLSAGIGSVQLNITQGPRDVLNRWGFVISPVNPEY